MPCRWWLVLLGAVVLAAGLGVGAQSAPTIDALVSLKRAGSPAISPDGRLVAYAIREANWDANEYETEIFLADTTDGTTRQLTNAKKSSLAPAWSRDGKRLAFISDRTDKRQVYLIDPTGGEAEALTSLDEGVIAFAWSPDGAHVAFTVQEPPADVRKERDRMYGEFEVVDRDHRLTQLHVIEVSTRRARRLTDSRFVVGAFDWSPDGQQIAFDHRINDDPANAGTANISVVALSGGSPRTVVWQDGPDTNPHWSPDGARIAFQSAMANPSFYFTNSRIALVNAGGGRAQSVTDEFDESPGLIDWTPQGIFFTASQRTWSHLFRLDPATRRTTRLAPAERWIGGAFSLSADARRAAFLGTDPQTFPEVYAATLEDMKPQRLTEMGNQTREWPQPIRDVISWKSQDGTLIEGVLHKPADFREGRRYPLLVVIHGGPAGVSRPVPFQSTSYYPIDVWLAAGSALVLEPNYRGSAGYGEAFRSLNVRNLGVGDAWDVISGIDHLVAEGLVDRDRVGAMGWSQGGYISAFLTTHDSARFRAISVGAGISDWMTYYVNTDIHPFTRQYLKATPWDDPGIYAKTSPITYIKGARTPTLIQHGENDRRVPIPNAYELYQGLQDRGVSVKLIVYKGFGHGLTKPKANRAAMQHNLEWFNERLLNAKTPTSEP